MSQTTIAVEPEVVVTVAVADAPHVGKIAVGAETFYGSHRVFLEPNQAQEMAEAILAAAAALQP